MLVMTPPSRSEIQRQITVERCRRSLYVFTREFWHILEPGKPFIESWHTEAICQHLQAVNDGLFNNLIICIPPGFAKSTIVSVMWFCHTWLSMPYIRFLYGSYDERLTFRDAGRCKDIINSKKYNSLFDPEWKINPRNDGTSFFANDLYGSRKTYYMTSTKKTGWRGEYLVVDDPLSAESRYDKNIKLKVIDTWDSTLWSRINRQGQHARVIIMQRLADDDLVGHILEKKGNEYVKLILPNEFDPESRCVTPIFEDPRTEAGELLCPELFSQAATEEAKSPGGLGPVDYSAQYQHKPVPAGGDRFQSQYFQYWNYVPGSPLLIQLNHRNGPNDYTKEYIRVDRIERIMSLDPALTEKKKSDYTSMGLWAKTTKSELILLHRIKFKKDEAGIVAAARELYSMQQWGRNPPSYIAVEANGLGIAVYQVLKDAGLPVKEVQVHKDKYTMSGVASTRIQGGQIFFPDYDIAPWMHEVTKELLSFPAGSHDDDVSMLCLAANDVFEQKMMTPRSITTIKQPLPKTNITKNINISPKPMFGNDKSPGSNGLGGAGGTSASGGYRQRR